MINVIHINFRWFQMISDDFRWFQMISDDFRWFQMVSDGFRYPELDTNFGISVMELILLQGSVGNHSNATSFAGWAVCSPGKSPLE